MGTGITDAVLEDIKSRIDLTELVASYGIEVRTSGSSKVACCPFHNEKTPSFHINENRGFYHCFGCGESGDAIKFVQKMEGLSFVETVKKLAEQCGVKITEREDPTAAKRKRLLALMAELAQFYHRCLLKTREAEPARAYLKNRDLGEEVQESFLIGYAPSGVAPILTWAEKHHYSVEDLADAGVVKPPNGLGDRGYHRFGGRLMFSIRDKQGRVVAFSGRQLVANKNSGKYVNSPETLIFKKSNVLFGFDKAAGPIARSAHREAIVCEGQIDTIRLHISGFPVAVASQGTAFTEEHARMLKKVADQVVLVFDDDAAGHKATVRTAGLFLAEEMPVRVVSLPNGDDPDSYLRHHSSDEFQSLLDNAESIMSFQVRSERAKEKDPASVDAMNRVVHALLQTIAHSTSAVLKAGMLGEAARLLGLPTLALQEELSKVRVKSPSRPAAPAPELDPSAEEFDPGDAASQDGPSPEDAPDPGEDAAAVVPPPALERAFMAFLMEDKNEYNADLDGFVGEYLPPDVFAHEFTRRFVETWRAECVENRDLFGALSASLAGPEAVWFNAVMGDVGKAQGSGEGARHTAEEFVRNLWIACLSRQLGALPAFGDDAASLQKLKLTMEIARLKNGAWEAVRDYIRAAQR